MDRTRDTGETVFVLVYDHKYGQDVHVVDSYETGKAMVYDIVEEWLGDYPEHEDKLRRLIADGDAEEVMNMWPDVTGEREYLNLNETKVWERVPTTATIMEKSLESVEQRGPAADAGEDEGG